MVKCVCSAAGDGGSEPQVGFSSHAEAGSHIQQLEGCATMIYNYLLRLWGKKGGGLAIDVSSEPVFLSKKRRISMDVCSGLIFLGGKNRVAKWMDLKYFTKQCFSV